MDIVVDPIQLFCYKEEIFLYVFAHFKNMQFSLPGMCLSAGLSDFCIRIQILSFYQLPRGNREMMKRFFSFMGLALFTLILIAPVGAQAAPSGNGGSTSLLQRVASL
ncbi:MAG: hypothetical protein HN720_16015, partial [Nitrospinaceae bacterium]|nr:hypothetical protein [Nitrospinaceae bacterium]